VLLQRVTLSWNAADTVAQDALLPQTNDRLTNGNTTLHNLKRTIVVAQWFLLQENRLLIVFRNRSFIATKTTAWCGATLCATQLTLFLNCSIDILQTK
jgi:hypothetical protein